jgi:hypothetical protein
VQIEKLCFKIYLHNKPSAIIEHRKKKLPCFTNISGEDILLKAPGQFNVRSEAGDIRYDVDINIPTCACPSWQNKHLPC